MVFRGSYMQRFHVANCALTVLEEIPGAARWFADLGFDKTALLAGREIYWRAYDAQLDSEQVRADSMGATDTKRQKFVLAKSRHSFILGLARMVIRDDEGRVRLGLNGRQPEAVDTWHGVAACFYQSLTEADMERLERVGVTPQRIEIMQDMLSASISATAAAKVARGAVVAANKTLQAAMKELAELVGDLAVMARIGEAANTNLAAMMKLTTRRPRSLPRYPGETEEDEGRPNKSAAWSWFENGVEGANVGLGYGAACHRSVFRNTTPKLDFDG